MSHFDLYIAFSVLHALWRQCVTLSFDNLSTYLPARHAA